MRIGIDISQLAFPGTGVAVYTEQLICHILKADKKNEYLLFGSSLRKREFLERATYFSHQTVVKRKIFALPQTFLRFLWNQLHLVNIEYFSGEIDVFHTSDWLEPPAKAKKVTTIHDLLVYKYPKHMHPAIVSNQQRKLKWVKKESSIVIADSESTKQDVVEYLKIPEEKLRVIYLGIDRQFFPRKTEEVERIKQKYKISKDYILNIGSVEPRKNTKRIIRAFETLSSKNFQLVIVGHHIWGERIKGSKKVVTIDLVKQNDLPALYSGAACFVYPSFYEGFGLPVIESMACGCPVVTSDRGSLKEVSGESAVIVDPEKTESVKEGIKQILESSNEDYEKRVKQGLLWANHFSWKKTAKETLKVYREIGSIDR